MRIDAGKVWCRQHSLPLRHVPLKVEHAATVALLEAATTHDGFWGPGPPADESEVDAKLERRVVAMSPLCCFVSADERGEVYRKAAEFWDGQGAELLRRYADAKAGFGRYRRGE